MRTALTIGADGLRSTVARAVGARPTWKGTAASAFVYGYWPTDIATDYHWFYRPGGAAGVIPTNDGQVCVWTAFPGAEFAARRRDGLDRAFGRLLAAVAPAAAHLVATTDRVGPLRGFPGAPARLHRAVGAGWALVGDAGSFKDPLTAHGITDALRDAELLARAAVEGAPSAFGAYEQVRDALTLPLMRVAERIAGYGWDTALATPFGELAATGRTFEVRVIDILTLTGGLVSEVTMVADELGQLAALGALRLA